MHEEYFLFRRVLNKKYFVNLYAIKIYKMANIKFHGEEAHTVGTLPQAGTSIGDFQLVNLKLVIISPVLLLLKPAATITVTLPLRKS